jgi:hypothetical protein
MRTLNDYHNMMKPNQLNSNLKLLLLSGKRWLRSNAANMDVRRVPVHHRNAFYLIGNSYSDTDKDLLKGNTFVWSDNVDPIIDQFATLISFAYEIKWPKMGSYLSKVDNVYMNTLEDPNLTNDDEFTIASGQLVDTNIIFGLLTELLLEQPSTPNGPTLI